MSHPSYGHGGPCTAHHVLPASPARLLLLAVVVVVFLDLALHQGESKYLSPCLCLQGGTWGCLPGPGAAGRGGGSSPPPTAPAPRLLFTHRHVCEPLPCSEIIGQKSKAVKIFHCPQEGLLSCRGCDTQHTPADPRRRCAPVCPSVRSRPPSVQNAALALCDLSPLRAAEAPERCRRSSRSCPTRTGIPQIPHAGRCEQGCASV